MLDDAGVVSVCTTALFWAPVSHLMVSLTVGPLAVHSISLVLLIAEDVTDSLVPSNVDVHPSLVPRSRYNSEL